MIRSGQTDEQIVKAAKERTVPLCPDFSNNFDPSCLGLLQDTVKVFHGESDIFDAVTVQRQMFTHLFGCVRVGLIARLRKE